MSHIEVRQQPEEDKHSYLSSDDSSPEDNADCDIEVDLAIDNTDVSRPGHEDLDTILAPDVTTPG